MKKVIILAFSVLIIASTGIFAQTNPLDNFINQYSGTKGFQFLEMKTNMLPGDETDETIGDRTLHLKMVSFKEVETSQYQSKDLYNDFFKKFDKDNYVGLVDIKSSGEHVEILVKKENQMVSEFIIAIREETETTLIAASGNFDLKNLAKLSEFQNCRGLHVLEKLCEE